MILTPLNPPLKGLAFALGWTCESGPFCSFTPTTEHFLKDAINTLCSFLLYIYLESENLAFHVPPTEVTRPCQYIEPAPADGGTLSGEKERFERYLNEIQTRCERVELLGKPKMENTQKSQNLNANSYICLGGKMGLQRRNCLVYSFG